MFRKAEFDILIKDGTRLYKMAESGWTFEIDGIEFGLYRKGSRWKVTDLLTGYGLHVEAATRGEAAAIFERRFFIRYLRTSKTADYMRLVEAFDDTPRYVAKPRPAFA